MDTTNQPTGEIPVEAPGAAENKQQAGADALPAETVTADQLAAPLAENMPIPTASNETQTEIPNVQEAIPAKPIPIIRDKTGKLFDPAKHAVDELWQPRFNKNGFFISKNIGNPGKKREDGNPGEQKPATDAGSTTPNANPEIGGYDANGNPGTSAAFTPVSGQPDQYDASADLYLQVGYGLASSFLGDGIRPEFKVEKRTTGGPGLPDQVEEVIRYTAEGKQEHESLRMPLAAMLREKQSTGMTPTQMFLVSLGAFIAKKSAKPTVRERFVLLFIKFKSWFSKSKLPNA